MNENYKSYMVLHNDKCKLNFKNSLKCGDFFIILDLLNLPAQVLSSELTEIIYTKLISRIIYTFFPLLVATAETFNLESYFGRN